jgi:hypothetical protein
MTTVFAMLTPYADHSKPTLINPLYDVSGKKGISIINKMGSPDMQAIKKRVEGFAGAFHNNAHPLAGVRIMQYRLLRHSAYTGL